MPEFMAMGIFSNVGGNPQPYLAKVNSDASFDSSFTPIVDGTILCGDKQSDGKIIIFGEHLNYNGIPVTNLMRINTDNTLDNTFSCAITGTVNDINVLASGKILIGGNFTLGTTRNFARLNSDGTLDETFYLFDANFNGYVSRILVLTDNSIVLCGTFTTITDTVSRVSLAKFDVNGVVDETFDLFIDELSGFTTVNRVRQRSDGDLIVCGEFQRVESSLSYFLQIEASGAPYLETYMDGPVADCDIQSDDKVVIIGSFTEVDTIAVEHIARVDAFGAFDGTFHSASFENGAPSNIEIITDDSIFVWGGWETTELENITYLARYYPTGFLNVGWDANIDYFLSTNGFLHLA
jgi:uncharacterized delta-60 repeat protein